MKFFGKSRVMENKAIKTSRFIEKYFGSKLAARVIWVGLITIIWQGISMSGALSPLIFPPLQSIFAALFKALNNGEILKETAFSLLLISKGLALGISLSALLAALSMASKIFGSLVETATEIAHPLPGIALLPIIILWLGTGENSIIFIIVHSIVWPLVLNISAGFRAVPPIYREVGENIGLSRLGMITGIMIPASLPYILAGVKIGWARSWRALISAEMIFGAVGGKGGLGWYIFRQRVFMDTPGMYAGLLVIILLGILVEDLVFARIEMATVRKWGKVI